MNANAAQAEHWNGPAGQLWATRCVRNEFRLANIHKALMAFAAPEPGMHVLDIGCGCGLTTVALAEAVAPGLAAGLDVSAPMLEAARGHADVAGLDIAFVEADASAHPFAPEYDLVFSRFGVMFFADPVAAFANIKRALKPGGRLAVSCWRALTENPWTCAPFEAARDLLPPQPPQEPHAPGQFAFADGERVKDILARAGFADIRVERCDVPVNLGADVDEAAQESLDHGALSRAAANIDAATREIIRERLRVLMARYATPNIVALPGSFWLVGAQT